MYNPGMAFRVDVVTLSDTPASFSLPGTWANKPEARMAGANVGVGGAWEDNVYYNAHMIDTVTVVEV